MNVSHPIHAHCSAICEGLYQLGIPPTERRVKAEAERFTPDSSAEDVIRWYESQPGRGEAKRSNRSQLLQVHKFAPAYVRGLYGSRTINETHELDEVVGLHGGFLTSDLIAYYRGEFASIRLPETTTEALAWAATAWLPKPDVVQRDPESYGDHIGGFLQDVIEDVPGGWLTLRGWLPAILETLEDAWARDPRA